MPDDRLREAVRAAIDTPASGFFGKADAVLAVPAIADALAGCHAITDDDGTSHCPLLEQDARAVARDAKVREIVGRPFDPAADLETSRYRSVADLYREGDQ